MTVQFSIETRAHTRVIRGEIEGHPPAVVDLVEIYPTLFIATHVGVPPELGGRGMGKKMVRQLIEYAREEGFRVVPQCPFVKALADKFPDWDDVIVKG